MEYYHSNDNKSLYNMIMVNFICQGLLLREGALRMLTKVLERCFVVDDVDGKQIPDNRSSTKCYFSFFSWCLPVFKCITLLFHSETSQQQDR